MVEIVTHISQRAKVLLEDIEKHNELGHNVMVTVRSGRGRKSYGFPAGCD